MMLLWKQLDCERSLMPCRNHGHGLLTSLEELMYLLHAALAPTLSRTYITRQSTSIKNKPGKKNTISTAGRERRREGGKDARTAGRKKQRPSSKMLRTPSNLHMILSQSCKSHAIYKCWFQNAAKTAQFAAQILAAKGCKYHATICNICALCR